MCHLSLKINLIAKENQLLKLSHILAKMSFMSLILLLLRMICKFRMKTLVFLPLRWIPKMKEMLTILNSNKLTFN